MSAAIDLRIEKKTFPKHHGTILRNLDLGINPGEIVSLIGPSGIGKTTLLHILSGLDQDFDGSLEITDSATEIHTPRIGYLFQSPRLMPWLTTLANIELVLHHEKKGHAVKWLQEVELNDCLDKYPHELSGGMQRRAALARAFAVEPNLLLLDEPFVSLDYPTATRLRLMLADLCRRFQPTVVVVTHDIQEAITLADRILLLDYGSALFEHKITLAKPRIYTDENVKRECQILFEKFPVLTKFTETRTSSA